MHNARLEGVDADYHSTGGRWPITDARQLNACNPLTTAFVEVQQNARSVVVRGCTTDMHTRVHACHCRAAMPLAFHATQTTTASAKRAPSTRSLVSETATAPAQQSPSCAWHTTTTTHQAQEEVLVHSNPCCLRLRWLAPT